MNPATDRFTFISRLLVGVTALCLLGGIARVVQLQVAPGDALQELMGSRTTNRTELHGRGSITDRRGRLIAFTQIGHRIYVDARLVWSEGLTEHADPFEHLAQELAGRCGLDADETYGLLVKTLGVSDETGELTSHSRYVVLVDDASDAMIGALASEPLRGVVAQKRPLRRYPYDSLAVQLLGKVGPGTGRRQRGRTGVELARHARLQPEHGSLEYVRDRSGSPMYVPEDSYTRGSDGEDVQLTIDLELQRKAEALLAAAVEAHVAVGGWLIVIDPRSGDVLAAADVFRNEEARARGGWPESWLDPLRDQSLAMARNRIWTDPFEPGSTFKPFFWSWATMRGYADPDEVLPTPGGQFNTSGVLFRDGRRSRRIKDAYGRKDADWSMALVKSLNTAMAMVAERLEPEAMQTMISTYGFSSRSGIAMPGEATGLRTSAARWDRLYTHLSVSFGQEIAVTPLQLARAFCVFARDDGSLPLLRITRIDESDDYLAPSLPVLTPEAVQTTRSVLARVMQPGGTGRFAASERYSIFGKSGTPQMPNTNRKPGEGGYFADRYMPNFLAAAPVDRPRIVVACGLQDPLKGSGANTDRNGHGYGGGYSAGRVVRDMIDHTLSYLGVPAEPPTASPR